MYSVSVSQSESVSKIELTIAAVDSDVFTHKKLGRTYKWLKLFRSVDIGAESLDIPTENTAGDITMILFEFRLAGEAPAVVR